MRVSTLDQLYALMRTAPDLRLYRVASFGWGDELSQWLDLAHDSAITALDMRRYGLIAPFLTVTTALFEAVQHFPGDRMPELFCGFDRRSGHGPTRYPIACEPRAWSAGSLRLYSRDGATRAQARRENLDG